MNLFKLTIINLFVLAVASVSFASDLKPDGTFELYVIPMEELETKTVTAYLDFPTKDGCNSFSLLGDLYMIQEESNLFMGLYQVMKTEIACDDGPERTVHVEAKLPNLYDPAKPEVLLMMPQGLKLNMQ